jgi:thiol-disulfide isomerase/thioredoxin
VARRTAAAALVVAVLLAGCASNRQPAAEGRPAPGFDAPAIVDGQRVQLATFRGRATLVNFWGSWCDPCRRELPRLVEAERAGTAVVGVAVKDSRRLARQMLADAGAAWASADDPDMKIARRWGVGSGFPVTFAVDAAGVIRGLHVGEMSAADIAGLVTAASR